VDDELGIHYSHANPMKRISKLDNITGMTHIGIRGPLNMDDWAAAGRTAKVAARLVIDTLGAAGPSSGR
jgi:hypothetical protein